MARMVGLDKSPSTSCNVEIFGEVHLSQMDHERLLNTDLSQCEAVFREGGQTEIPIKDISVGYALFAIGYLLYGITYGRTYKNSEPFEQKVDSVDLPLYQVDADLRETYEMLSRSERILSFLFAPFVTIIVISIPITIGNQVLAIAGASASDWLIFLGGLAFLFIFGLGWVLAYFLLAESRVMKRRDSYMVDVIRETIKSNGYSTVMISCGDAHRTGIADTLEAEGWDVQEYPTTHWLRLLSKIPLIR